VCYIIKKLSYALNIDVLKTAYFASVQPVMEFGIIFW
jgi:hypothetical protein